MQLSGLAGLMYLISRCARKLDKHLQSLSWICWRLCTDGHCTWIAVTVCVCVFCCVSVIIHKKWLGKHEQFILANHLSLIIVRSFTFILTLLYMYNIMSCKFGILYLGKVSLPWTLTLHMKNARSEYSTYSPLRLVMTWRCIIWSDLRINEWLLVSLGFQRQNRILGVWNHLGLHCQRRDRRAWPRGIDRRLNWE